MNRPTISNQEIATSFRERFLSIIFTRQQLKNARYKLRKAQLDGYTLFQVTIKCLDKKGTYYLVMWAPKDPTKPLGLFWSFKWCVEEWKKTSKVQMYNNTYRTNNKGLVLFQIISISFIGKAFSCGFGFINNKR